MIKYLSLWSFFLFVVDLDKKQEEIGKLVRFCNRGVDYLRYAALESESVPAPQLMIFTLGNTFWSFSLGETQRQFRLELK